MPDFESRTGDWLPFDEALTRILRHPSPLPSETVPLEEALGRALADDVLAPGPLPPWDNSAMDGYAVRGDDVRGATKEHPVVLVVTGVIHAGTRFEGTVGRGDAVRIMTGGEVPAGADTVIRVEDTDGEETDTGNLRIYSERDRGRHVRPAGQDWLEGAIVLESGTGIGPGQTAVLAAARASLVSVHRRPKVAILASGDELVDLDSPHLDPHQIAESNSHYVSAGRSRSRWDPQAPGHRERRPGGHTVPSRQSRRRRCTRDSGWGLHGRGDLFKTVLEDLGLQLDFWRVKIRPGSPMSFGRLPLGGGGSQTVFGLPGNPASAFVTFELFVRPFVLALAGHIRLHRPTVTALAAVDLTSTEDITGFLRVRLSRSGAELEASLTGPQGSGLVGSLGAADGLASSRKE